MPRQDLQLVADTIAESIESTRNLGRVIRGITLRRQMLDSLANDTPFDHYRKKWVLDGVDRVLALLQEVCREFDAAHPDDMATSFDMHDMLRGALNQVESLTGIGQGSPPADERKKG